MNIKELEDIMISYGVVLRAIPKKKVSIYEKQHISKFPNGVIKYHAGFKRDMLIVESIPKNAGKFLFESMVGTDRMVSFSGKNYFDSIEEAIKYLLDEHSLESI